MRSSTYFRQAKKIQDAMDKEASVEAAIKRDEKLRDGFTESDRSVAEQQEARDLYRAFLAEGV